MSQIVFQDGYQTNLPSLLIKGPIHPKTKQANKDCPSIELDPKFGNADSAVSHGPGSVDLVFWIYGLSFIIYYAIPTLRNIYIISGSNPRSVFSLVLYSILPLEFMCLLFFSSSCVKFLVKFIYMSVSTLCNYHFLFYLLTRCVLFAFLLILHPCLVDCDSVRRVLFSPTVSTDPNHYPVYILSQSPFVRVSVIFLSCLPAPVCPSPNSQFRFR